MNLVYWLRKRENHIIANLSNLMMVYLTIEIEHLYAHILEIVLLSLSSKAETISTKPK